MTQTSTDVTTNIDEHNNAGIVKIRKHFESPKECAMLNMTDTDCSKIPISIVNKYLKEEYIDCHDIHQGNIKKNISDLKLELKISNITNIQ